MNKLLLIKNAELFQGEKDLNKKKNYFEGWYFKNISMENTINGYININDEIIHFNNNKGYIEKDWGCSFPKSYIWGQGNNFKKTNSSFMFSIADIPLKLFTFKGFICVLLI